MTLDRQSLLDLSDDELIKLCRQECFRSSGPGGQHRNTRDSAVRLTLRQDERVVAEADESRSQHQNRQAAIERLRLEIAFVMRTESVEQWRGQLRFNHANPEYSRFVALVLDALTVHEWRVGEAAEALGLSTGKLNRALFQDRRLWQLVNSRRAELGMGALRPPS